MQTFCENTANRKTRFADHEPRKGADILVEALEREGVTDVFAYPGGASIQIHEALSRSSIRNILPRHEQGGVFAAEGYARASGRPGVCMATSGPGATNLVTGLADAMMDSIPIVAVTGQVPRGLMGTDAFQDIPIVEITRPITKHSYIVLGVEDIPRIVRQAFFLASTGRPGPVLIGIPKDIQHELSIPDWDGPVSLSHYQSRLPKSPAATHLEQVITLVSESKRPVLYVGGGCLKSSNELRKFLELTRIPVASTLMGLGVYRGTDDELFLGMLGMHGTFYANYAVHKCDLLLAFGVRFDDRVTGKLEYFARRSKIVHIDIDSSELGKNKKPDVSIWADIKLALQGLNRKLNTRQWEKLDFSFWIEELKAQKRKHPLAYMTFIEETIPAQYAIKVLNTLTGSNAIITTGVGQHQMWVAQFYKFIRPRQLLSSGGMGAMGFGLPAAMGVAVAKPGAVIVDIDGDGSFIMNVQELATIRAENLPVKVMILNNQHLGMIAQGDGRFYNANKAHSYIGNPSSPSIIFPDMQKIAEAFQIPSTRVSRRVDLQDAMKKMLETPGPYLLDVIISQEVELLPMIPTGGGFVDTITDGAERLMTLSLSCSSSS